MKTTLFEKLLRHIRAAKVLQNKYRSYHNTPMYHPSQIEAGQKAVNALRKVSFKKDDAGYRKQIRSVSNQMRQQKYEKQRSNIPINHDLADRLKQHIANKQKPQ